MADTDFKLVPDHTCASCQMENTTLAEFPRRSYVPGRDTPESATVLLCQICAGTFISLRTVHYPQGDTDVFAVMAQTTHVLLAELGRLRVDVTALRAEVVALRADMEGTEDEEPSEPRPEMKVCANCHRAISLVEGVWVDTDPEAPDFCAHSREYGNTHEPEEEAEGGDKG